MWRKLISIITWIGILYLIIAGLKELGLVINRVIDWSMLTNAFSIVRYYIAQIDWIFPTDIIFTLIGLEMSFFVAEWVFMATLMPIDHKLRND